MKGERAETQVSIALVEVPSHEDEEPLGILLTAGSRNFSGLNSDFITSYNSSGPPI